MAILFIDGKKIDFCMRLKAGWWLKVRELAQSSKTEDTVTFTLPKKDWDKLKHYPEIRDKVLTLRLIKVLLPTGETEILGTSLLDQESYRQGVSQNFQNHLFYSPPSDV